MEILSFRKYAVLGFLILFPLFGIHASEALKVDSIIIKGNNTTRDEIILRELTFGVGDTVNSEILKYNKERVYSLGLFTNVRFRGIQKAEEFVVRIDVEESWYIWPIPFAQMKDNTISKITYGVNLLWKNFRGRNETLSTTVGLGYDPSFSITYSNPWLIRKDNVFMATALSYKQVVNKSIIAEKLYGQEFDQKMIGYSLTIGKRFDIYNEASISGSFLYTENPDNNQKISFSGSPIARIPSAGLSYTYDNRNLKQFPDSGFYGSFTYVYSGFGAGGIDYSVLRTDIRNYGSLWGDLSFKWRMSGRYTTGRNIPLFENSMLGVDEKIRGYYSHKREGDLLYTASAELRYPLISDWTIKVKLPIVPKQLTSYRLKVFMSVFTNTGTVIRRDELMALKKFDSGYGVGLTFLLLPYNAVRIEYALNENNEGEFIFGTGFSF